MSQKNLLTMQVRVGKHKARLLAVDNQLFARWSSREQIVGRRRQLANQRFPLVEFNVGSGLISATQCHKPGDDLRPTPDI
jgi:hypothetical protein